MELKYKCDATEKKESEKRQLEDKKHQEEMQSLKKTNQQLKVRHSTYRSWIRSTTPFPLPAGPVGRTHYASEEVAYYTQYIV